MMRTKFYKISTVVNCCFLFVYFTSCNGQPKIDECKLNYKNANNNLNAYYKSNKQSLLRKAVDYTEKAMQCPETRRQAIERKISLLALLKDYKTGYEFVSSLDDDKDFTRAYKKNMHCNIFRALEYESKADTNSAHKLYIETINHIDNYLQAESKTRTLDQEAYYDLFFVKSKILLQEQINNELDNLGKKYPSDKDFFITLKSSFVEIPKEVNPVRN